MKACVFLKARRLLAQNERPADIIRRRLIQAGYDESDSLNYYGGEDMTFIYKFVYKSQALGSTEEDNPLKLDGFELVDVSANGLLTIPVILHKHADSIVVLKLSRNPIVDIPTDFIQSCIQLKQLFLCQMAMKKVPHSIRESKTLQLLDLSFNRIVELEDAYLDQIPGLVTLRVQNNRLESIPWYFPRLRHLANLNISNNKLRTFPRVIAQLEALEDLDVSFNMITELPEELGKLEHLKRLNILANQIGRFPDDCASMHALEILDCRRNAITDLSVISGLPMLRQLLSDHNAIHALDLELAPELVVLDVSSNDITRFSIRPSSLSQTQICALTSLDMSHAKLSSIPPETLGHLLSLNTLILNYNTFRELPDSLGDLEFLEFLSIANNALVALPKTIGSLQRLTKLDVHSNSLREFPIEIWHCSRLKILNATSNLLSIWHSPPAPPPRKDSRGGIDAGSERKGSGLGELASSVDSSSGSLPPLSQSLQRLYLGENRLTDESLLPLTLLYSLEVLNLSFNDITDLPSSFFKSFTQLQAVYLSGNKLTSLPTEDMPRLSKLTTLFLNGNRMTTLPADLAKVQTLMSLDVGSNNLKYNINNWEFDWNWNFNPKLKYLNLSGNTKLQIKSDVTTFSPNHRFSRVERSRKALSGFTDLNQLRVLGLMDVTIITTGDNASIDIPDENEDRRVRTSLSTVNGMSYGISDTLGKNDELNMIDLVHEFRAGGGAVFAMFGRAEPPKGVPPGGSTNRLAKVLHDEFIRAFDTHLGTLNPERGDTVPDALRRTFLWLNKYVHDRMFGSAKRITPPVDPGFARSGASGIVLYFKDTMLYVANCGNALAVICKNGTAHALSTKHDPWDPGETQRIRAADGWISPQGLVNDEIDLSRSFGFYHLLPVVNARPDINAWELSELDEFVIVGNRGLWDYVSYQTAVDIARSEGENTMVAAQKLRDIAISYGAEGSTMIMVIRVSDLFRKTRPIQPPPESVVDTHAQQVFGAINDIRAKKNQITDRNIARLAREVAPPTGNITIVFTDIRNSTHLWEANPGMNTAMRLHNNLLRRQLRFCRGYEVKTEGDAFMCSFPSAMSALWWCLTVQLQLLQEEWPLEILECEDGKPIYDSENRLIARGLSVRMGIHCGAPLCERDPLTDRMDYFGPMVNRAARICGSAGGGQIMCSADIVREINARIFETEPPTLDSNEIQFQHDSHPGQAIPSVKRIGITVIPVGEVKLKGLELPEVLSLVFPKDLEARQDLKEDKEDPKASGSRIQFSVSQMRQLGILCLRLEAIASSRVFCFTSERKESVQTSQSKDTTDREQEPPESVRFYGDPDVLLPPITEKSSDFELMMVLDSFSVRIENALSTIDRRLHERTLQNVLSALQSPSS
ncbi:hypothetical protein FISHEDRAFT_63353 [Fistulina hepatica ATCC 64428]|uniref:Adenylate cyclase n=1 Tax=Fistulina hepatica ATCC 64428 TaxID=1128425 RepID=A0A0D7ANI7_9AGAR|nr:hypothetical protein FISHEDRAFT_63353 [Fistulina hepatica ATCC 64428]